MKVIFPLPFEFLTETPYSKKKKKKKEIKREKNIWKFINSHMYGRDQGKMSNSFMWP